MPKNDVRFTACLSRDDDNRLRALCNQNNDSKGATIRRAVRALYNMEILGQPTCANGLNCYVPHMHQAQMAFGVPALPAGHVNAPKS